MKTDRVYLVTDTDQADAEAAGPSDADRLRDWLTEHGRTQRWLARELGVDERTVRYWASGQQPVPHVVWLALERLALDAITPE